MTRQKMTCTMYIPINGKPVPWYKVDEDGNVEWYLPKDVTDPVKQKMLDNISNCISESIL